MEAQNTSGEFVYFLPIPDCQGKGRKPKKEETPEVLGTFFLDGSPLASQIEPRHWSPTTYKKRMALLMKWNLAQQALASRDDHGSQGTKTE